MLESDFYVYNPALDEVASTIYGRSYARYSGRSNRERDTQRARVYLADRALFPSAANHHLPKNRTLGDIGEYDDQRVFQSEAEIQDYVDMVQADSLWKQLGGRAIRVTVKRANARKHRGTAHCGATPFIVMARWTWFEQYVLHELAHQIEVPKDPTAATHGPAFVACLYHLTERFMGKAAGERYKLACRREGVRGIPTAPVVPTTSQAAHEMTLAAGTPVAAELLTAGEQGWVDSYRRFKAGQRSSAPKLRKGMTRARADQLKEIA
jgi:putative metallohydrolase (TIGR04338 family)